mgnify:CR=1 FL=1
MQKTADPQIRPVKKKKLPGVQIGRELLQLMTLIGLNNIWRFLKAAEGG